MTAVTVSITRHIDPEHNAEMLAWVQAGASLAERFDGFLGVGWVRPAVDSDVWHMLYRFADPGSLTVWEASAQRRWWLAAAQGRIGESRVERRTGIEGWFDEPTTYDVSDAAAEPPPPPAPPRWKQMVTIFLVFFPLSLGANWVAGETIAHWSMVPRVLTSVVVMTPLMTYIFLPWITQRMAWWLHGQPAPWRR